MKWARIVGGQVHEISYEAVDALNWFEVPDNVYTGFLADGHGGFSAPVPVVTLDHVIIERNRRLALGFDYDFGDARGVHRIGTTDADMAGWSEVTTLAQTRLVLGMSDVISIVTDTGQVDVTPTEWMNILLAASAFRQPIWAKSFVLQAADPIPADYTADAHWS